jgi:hypothetical protein
VAFHFLAHTPFLSFLSTIKLNQTQVTGKLSDMWRSISVDRKRVYLAQSERDQVRYKREMNKYMREGGGEGRECCCVREEE